MGKWNKIKLGIACQISKGQQLNKIDLEKAGDYPCINGGIEPSGYTDKWNTEANTITLSEGGNSCGFVNFLTTRFWSGGHCYSLLNLKENIDVNFLYQALKGRESLIMGLRVGSGLPNIQQKAVKEFEFEYPEEKPEQIRIAQILSKADEGITQTEALIAKYQRIKTGLMQDLLTKGIDENGNIRSKTTHKFVVKKGVEVPEEWEVVEFEFCYRNPIRDFGSFSSTKQIEFLDQGIPFLKSEMIGVNTIKWENVSFISKEVHLLLNKSFVRKGNVLFSKIGSALGKAVVYENEYECNSNAAIAKIDLDPKKANKHFISYFLNFDFAQEQFKNMIVSLLPRINLGDINKLIVKLPKIKEQEIIVYRIMALDNSINTEKIFLLKLQSLKAGLMQDLLSGKVRVVVN